MRRTRTMVLYPRHLLERFAIDAVLAVLYSYAFSYSYSYSYMLLSTIVSSPSDLLFCCFYYSSLVITFVVVVIVRFMCRFAVS